MLAARDRTSLATRGVLLALPDGALTMATADRLRRSGWRVYHTVTCDALRRLTCRIMPDVVVLPADGPDESGWLTCAKLLRAEPRLRVIVVGGPTPDGPELARFLGVEGPVPADVSAEELAELIEGAQRT
jgi:hypothetical protein